MSQSFESESDVAQACPTLRQCLRAPPTAQSVKNLPAVQETGLSSWVGKIPWRRKWQPTPVFLPGESPRQRSPVGYGPWGRKSQTRLSNYTTTTKETRVHADKDFCPILSKNIVYNIIILKTT